VCPHSTLVGFLQMTQNVSQILPGIGLAILEACGCWEIQILCKVTDSVTCSKQGLYP
jgi:hypothetical protein